MQMNSEDERPGLARIINVQNRFRSLTLMRAGNTGPIDRQGRSILETPMGRFASRKYHS
jgi:hypothetical protein